MVLKRLAAISPHKDTKDLEGRWEWGAWQAALGGAAPLPPLRSFHLMNESVPDGRGRWSLSPRSSASSSLPVTLLLVGPHLPHPPLELTANRWSRVG